MLTINQNSLATDLATTLVLHGKTPQKCNSKNPYEFYSINYTIELVNNGMLENDSF